MKIISPGCDYLTLSVKAGRTLAGIENIWQELQGMRYDQGHQTEDWRFQQYTGVKIGDFQRGYSETHGLFVAQGSGAQVAVESLQGITFEGNITRCDVKADIQGTAQEVYSPRDFDAAWLAKTVIAGTDGRRRSGITRGADGGDTATIGSRDSDNYFRCYRADIKHPDQYFGPTVRFELETHGERARGLYTRINAATDSRKEALGAVVGRLSQLGLTQPWCEGIDGFTVKLSKPETNYAKSLRWLASGVRGVVRGLLEAGYSTELEEALGLPFGCLRDES